MKRILVALGVLGLSALAIIILVQTHAQKQNEGLTLHPSNFELNLTPNQTYTGVVYVDNHTKNPVDIAVTPKNFTAEGEEGGVDITQKDTTYSLAKWIKVTPNTATIPANSESKFTFEITPPKDAEIGGHFGTLVFATVPPKDTKGSGAALSQEIAALILAKVPGDVKEKAKVVSFTTDKKFYEFGPATFILRVGNEGGIHIAPFGSIQVTDIFGRTTDVKIDPKNVLPGSTRKISAIMKNKLLIGKYTGKIIASYGSNNQPLIGSVTFYAFPVRYGAIALVVLILLFLLRNRIAKALKMIVTGK